MTVTRGGFGSTSPGYINVSNAAPGDLVLVYFAGNVLMPAGWTQLFPGTSSTWWKTWTSSDSPSISIGQNPSGVSLTLKGNAPRIDQATSGNGTGVTVSSTTPADWVVCFAQVDPNSGNTCNGPATYQVVYSELDTGVEAIALDSNGTVGQGSYSESGSSGVYFIELITVRDALTPLAASLYAPANGSFADLTAPTFGWGYNNVDGSSQGAWAFRQKISGASSYNYWSVAAAAWQSTIVWNPGSSTSYTFPSGAFSNGNVYNWSVACQSSYGASYQGPFATDSTVVGQAAPTVTLTAPTGAQATSQPTVTGTTTAAPGAAIISYQVVVYPQAATTAPGFTPGQSGAAWDSTVVTGAWPTNGVQVGVALANEQSWVAYAQVTEAGNEASAWASQAFSTAYSLPPTPGVRVINTTDANGVPCLQLQVNVASTSDTDLTVSATFTDAFNATATPLRNGTAIPITSGGSVTIVDYEAVPGAARTYSVTVTGQGGGASVTSNAATATGTLTVNSWWLIEPLNPANSLAITVTDNPTTSHESVAVHYPLSPAGVPTPPTVISGGINGQDGSLVIQTQSQAQYQALLASTSSGTVKWLLSPYGTGNYIRTSAASPVGGMAGAAHQTTVTRSPVTTPVRTSTVTYVGANKP